ncbi:methyltransferase family protein [Halothermothrix orenii]|uniref:Isoprenylcysteine carboxyl methyltransferase n=1 Tax=Halothermothrix orenii (strain H 168 / OCM 544 / DSM 9562) TaxID=373903 RepID=B8CXS6_HALOH|nr:isoprenylcysteine carboxylmethyltransferase family protein [Halothermothrix orenii]ACL70095.1 Isoprenylcysteine carboxyl methyltransferase [Halothermothrix orenii H 168]
MKKVFNTLTKLLVISLFVYTWSIVEANGGKLNRAYIYLYITLVVISLISDRYFYKGQKSENKKKYEMTSSFISFTWFTSLIIPVLEYGYIMRNNSMFTIIGAALVIAGITIRGIGIKTLGKYFSRDVETWDDHKIVRTGIYKYIRHPAYAGNILQIIGFPLILNSYFSLILSLITIYGFIWRIRVEESFLKKEIPEYEEYMRETKRIVPKIW